MKTPLKSNRWSKYQLAILKICYEQRVPIKLMTQVLNKSETSISKMLTRSNIRPIGSHPRGMRPLALRSHYITKEDVLNLISNAHQSPAAIKQSFCYHMSDQKVYVNAEEQPKRLRQNGLEVWTSLAHLLKELELKGKIIIRTDDPSLLRQGFEYVLNGRPTKCIDLLRIVNTERAALSLPRIFIEGITDNN
jgi:hypothetical protein